VPLFFRSRITRIRQDDAGLAIEVNGQNGPHLIADAVAVGDGLMPDTSLTRLLRLDHTYVPLSGGWTPEVTVEGRTKTERVYVAGDAAGIAGALAAYERGCLAGLAAARDLGTIDSAEFARRAMPIRARLLLANTFAAASRKLMAVSFGPADIPDETIVCRCEDVSAKTLRAVVGEGATDLNQVKAWTRAGMGPCQGKICGHAVAIVAGHARGNLTPRSPVRPFNVRDLVGRYEAADIPPRADLRPAAERYRDWR
jgi:bacterioferritin-associated ferredoxin